MEFIKKIPATLTLIVVNCAVFYWLYSKAGSFDEPLWTLGMLENGALYNPYTLDGQWDRLFTSMFLHAHIFHLLFNMYGLFAVGQDVEINMGIKKFLLVYFLGGVAAGLSSMYFNIFTIGVGASGAIFSLFGFALIMNISRSRRDNQPIGPLIVNFLVFLGINIILAETLNADNSAHIGGALSGMLIGAISLLSRRSMNAVGPELIIAPILIVVFFALPRFQVRYFNFFQKVLEAQDSSHYVLSHSGSMSNEEFLKDYRRVNMKWDTAMSMLNAQEYLPPELHSDTFKLRKIIRYHKAESDYRIIMVENESYIYADSIDIASDSLRKFMSLKYVLNMKYNPVDSSEQKNAGPPLETVRVWYDTNWVEIPYPPAAYFRIGQKDSAGLWQGPLTDFYRTGNAQMKGSYKNDLKDGIFIYYTENEKYSAAGVYNEDQRVGKWETFHPNGQIESEVYYRERYFLKSYWDSTGVQMVKDGFGKEIHKYSNGVIASEGEYADGYQHGYWYGRHANGDMYFEENYNRGRLINGRSRSKTGKTFVYDETTLFALPVGGFKKLNDYILSQTRGMSMHGTVKLSFRVTVSGQLTDFKTEQSVSKELDAKARQIVLSGPRWLPAKLHGQEPTDGFAFVNVEF
jgi:membrane associated rhomboid family serine protease/antitoxin component YwqK of YwqJK toxin-antitoxin module